jgi:hypothetical protein
VVEVNRMSVTWYEQKQTGWKAILVLSVILGALAIAVLAVDRVGAPGEAKRMGWGLAAVFLVVMVTNRLELKLDERELLVRWGWILWRHVPLSSLESVERERIGWTMVGMKHHKKAWWYSVSTGPALRFRFRNGKSIVVGTPDPDGLLRALQSLKPGLFKEKA